MEKMARICPAMGIFFYLFFMLGGCPTSGALELVGFDLSNQLEYSWNTEDDEETLENWLDVTYRLDVLTTGIRYQAFQPSKPRPPQLRSEWKEGIALRYFTVEKDGIQLRGGDYYAIFGRGLALRAYEDRDIRVDNKLDGFKFQGYYRGVEAALLTGRPPRENRDLADRLRGLNVSFQPSRGLIFGGSYVSLKAPGAAGRGTEITTARVEAFRGPLSLYGELAKRTYRLGYGLYLSSSLSLSGFAITAELKDYDRIALRTGDGLDYNTPPALTREHAYSLFRRHPRELDAEDEVGFQVECSLSPLWGTSLLLNYSYTAEHAAQGAQPARTPEFFGEYGQPLFRETYVEVTQEIGEKISLIGAAGRSLAPGVETYTGALDLSLYLDPLNSLRFELQGQHVEELGEYDDHQLTVEFARAPLFSLSLGAEHTNKSEKQRRAGEATSWFFAQADLHLTENHDVTLLAGSRQGGFFCTGGRCRWEPEFEGVELKLFSHF
jgi:hypothetical protein